MSKSDPLLYALRRIRISGSGKTVRNNKQSAELFVRALRDMGYGVEKWTNLRNRHIGDVVQYWLDNETGTTATLKNYLAGVRAICHAVGNASIHKTNDVFGLDRRVYVSNIDKSVARELYNQAVSTLCASDDPLRQRVALMLEFQKRFGMRVEESTKFNPFLDDQGGQAHIHRGTKGGRPRWVPIRTAAQRELLDRAKQSGFYPLPSATIIPKGWSEKQWRSAVYAMAREMGLTRLASGATMHGLRHAYAHERYEDLTGFKAPVQCASQGDYRAQAQEAAGDEWSQRDQLARAVVREELGHSPDRADIDAQYLGSVVK